MMHRLALQIILGLALTTLVGCAAQGNGATPTAIPLSGVSPTPATSDSRAPMGAVSAATPRPVSTAASAMAAPALESAPTVRSGRLLGAVELRARPDDGAAVLGSLPAGARVIVTAASADWLEIIFADAPGGHAYLPQNAVDFAAAQPEPTVAPETAADAATAPPVTGPVLPTPTVSAPSAPVAPAVSQPALTGTLVFQTSNGGDIYIMNADGSGLRRLTYGFDPALSPDGQQVAFTRWDEPRGLWMIDVDGGNERHLFTANRPRSPTWTPDGAAIIFERNLRERICRSSPFGCLSDEELLSLFGGQSCLTTPFGTICIADFPLTTLSATALVRYELANGAVRDLPASETATAPQHNPSDAAVLYLDRDGLALTQNAGDVTPQRLLSIPPLLGPAAYSPDGQFIYAARQMGGHWDIWRWQADGGAPVALTSKDPLAREAPNNVAPTISPDGQQVAFLTDRTGQWEPWVMNNDGSNPRPLASQALADLSLRFDFNADRAVDWGP